VYSTWSSLHTWDLRWLSLGQTVSSIALLALADFTMGYLLLQPVPWQGICPGLDLAVCSMHPPQVCSHSHITWKTAEFWWTSLFISSLPPLPLLQVSTAADPHLAPPTLSSVLLSPGNVLWRTCGGLCPSLLSSGASLLMAPELHARHASMLCTYSTLPFRSGLKTPTSVIRLSAP